MTIDVAALPTPRPRRRKGVTAATAQGRAALYLRVSTSEQSEDGGSLSSQEAACRALCVARGLEVTAVLTDGGASGGSLDRPALDALRATVAAGEAAVVVVYAVDRLSRSQRDTLALLDEFERHGAGLMAASQPFETASPAGRALLGMLAVFAELQRAEIRSRTRMALAAKKARGEAVSRTPYGLRRNGPGFERDPATWPVVERILRERIDGKTCAQIAADLNADGVAPSSGNGRWHHSRVSSLTANPNVLAAALNDQMSANTSDQVRS